MRPFSQITTTLRSANPFASHDGEGYADNEDASWTQIDWSPYVQTRTIDGTKLNFIDTGGDGQPIVFIHGVGGSWQNWLLNAPVFMATNRVVAVDLPGFGESDLPQQSVTISGYAALIDALCLELGIECTTIVGSSLGGFIGAEIALSFPTRVATLVLVSSAGLSPDERRRAPIMAAAQAWSATSAWALAHRDILVRRPRLRQIALQPIFRHPEKLSAPLMWELIQGAGKPGFLPALEAITSYPLADRLEKIECPTLIMWGESDLVITPKDAQRFADLIGDNSEILMFPDTGHLPMLERPRMFNHALAAFIAQHDTCRQTPSQ